MNNKEKKALDKVLNSTEFKNSEKYSNLLLYLIEATKKHDIVKEITIAFEFFNKDASYNTSEDPSVRIYVKKLRQKLEHYYLTAGREDAIRICIPKGHYNVKFTANQSSKQRRQDKQKRVYYLFISVTVILLLIILLLVLQLPSPHKGDLPVSKKNPVWHEFLSDSDTQNLVVFGDYFFLYERNNVFNENVVLRSYHINNRTDFKRMLRGNPQLINRYTDLNFTYLRPNSIWSLIEILPILLHSENRIICKLASEVTLDDLNEYNLIYIGDYKTLYKLEPVLSTFNFQFSLFPPETRIKDKTFKTINISDSNQTEFQTDYPMLVKHHLHNNNFILMMLGFSELGIIEGVRTITSPDFYTEIKSKYPEIIEESPFLFEIMVKVDGKRNSRTAWEKSIINFHQILEKPSTAVNK